MQNFDNTMRTTISSVTRDHPMDPELVCRDIVLPQTIEEELAIIAAALDAGIDPFPPRKEIHYPTVSCGSITHYLTSGCQRHDALFIFISSRVFFAKHQQLEVIINKCR